LKKEAFALASPYICNHRFSLFCRLARSILTGPVVGRKMKRMPAPRIKGSGYVSLSKFMNI
jgi:hypothetical protein